MEYWFVETNSMFRAFPDTSVDMDFKDEGFFQGYWMGITDEFNLLEPDYEYEPPKFQPTFGSNHLSLNSYHEMYQDEMEKYHEEIPLDCMGIKEHVTEITTSLFQSQSGPLEGAEFGGKWWVESLEGGFEAEGSQEFVNSPVKDSSLDETSLTPTVIMEDETKGEYAYVSWGYPKEEPEDVFKVITHWEKNDLDLNFENVCPAFEKPQQDSSATQGRLIGVRKPGEKRQTKPEKTISLQVLRQHFACSLKDAAKNMGVCPTTLKRICRQYGIMRWPSRKIKKVSHSLKKLQLVVDSVEGAEGLIKINSLDSTFPEFSSPDLPKDNLISSSHKLNNNSKKPKSQPDLKSDSSSSSQNSGSSFSYSIEAKQFTVTTNGLNLDHSSDSEEAIVVPQNSFGESKLQPLKQEQSSYSQCHKKSGDHLGFKILPQISGEGGALKVKATFGESKIRFSLQPHWTFKDLQLEIAKRFRIDDCNGIHLKYLDNDFESVLLTCDEDLQECKDLFRSSYSHTIKMSLHKFPQLRVACS